MKELTDNEKGWLAIIRLNEKWTKEEIVKRIKIGNYVLKLEWRSKNNLWGRFGGGWNWKLGIQIGGTTIIISLLIFTISIRRAK